MSAAPTNPPVLSEEVRGAGSDICRVPSANWRWRQSSANSSLKGAFPVPRENTGKFRRLNPVWGSGPRISEQIQSFPCEFPRDPNREFSRLARELPSAEQGKLQAPVMRYEMVIVSPKQVALRPINQPIPRLLSSNHTQQLDGAHAPSDCTHSDSHPLLSACVRGPNRDGDLVWAGTRRQSYGIR
jgi:hypothetical protein